MTFNNLLPKLSRCFGFLTCCLIASGVIAQDKIDFVKVIKPILEKHCISCHGPEKEESFRIDIRDDAMDYIEDTAEDSHFYQVLISDDEEEIMPPPDEGTPLTDDQIQSIQTWINEGANWPEGIELVDASQTATPPTTPDQKPDAPDSPSTESDDTTTDSQPTTVKPADAKPGSDTEEKKEEKKVSKKTQQIYNAIGSLHPAAIHLPIGLLLASGLFALFSLRGNFVMSDCAYYCLWLGTLGAIVGCVTGWWFSPMEKRGTVEVFADLFDQDHKVFWHRTGGLVVTAFALVLALFAAGARNRDPDDGMLWKLGLILLAGGIGWVGHTGGELHYPSDHYKDLNSLYQSIVAPEAAEKENAGGAMNGPNDRQPSGDGTASEGDSSDGTSADGDSSNDENDEVGTASGESIKSIDKEMTKSP